MRCVRRVLDAFGAHKGGQAHRRCLTVSQVIHISGGNFCSDELIPAFDSFLVVVQLVHCSVGCIGRLFRGLAAAQSATSAWHTEIRGKTLLAPEEAAVMAGVVMGAVVVAMGNEVAVLAMAKARGVPVDCVARARMLAVEGAAEVEVPILLLPLNVPVVVRRMDRFALGLGALMPPRRASIPAGLLPGKEGKLCLGYASVTSAFSPLARSAAASVVPVSGFPAADFLSVCAALLSLLTRLARCGVNWLGR